MTRKSPIREAVTAVSIALAAFAIIMVILLVRTFNNVGTKVYCSDGLGVYTTGNCSTPVTFIDWGSLAPGTSQTYTVYVKNNQATPIVLGMYTANWDPPHTIYYLTMTWNREGAILDPGNVISAVFTLKVSPTANESLPFSFDIIVSSVEYIPGAQPPPLPPLPPPLPPPSLTDPSNLTNPNIFWLFWLIIIFVVAAIFYRGKKS